MIVYLLHTSALNFPNRDCSEQCGDDGLLVHFNDYSIFFCETMRISSYLTFPESCGGLASVVIVAAARGEGESSKHHKCDSPEFHCFHFAKNFNFLNYFVWQSYRKSHEKAPDKTENRMPGVKL